MAARDAVSRSDGWPAESLRSAEASGSPNDAAGSSNNAAGSSNDAAGSPFDDAVSCRIAVVIAVGRTVGAVTVVRGAAIGRISGAI
jgi:hypothetical protein